MSKAWNASQMINGNDSLLEAMKKVDGNGSELDADLLRGLPADFTCSKNQNGYTKLPNGLIIQWGLSPTIGSQSSQNVTLPLTYPTEIWAVFATNNGNGNLGGEGAKVIDNSTIKIGHYNNGDNSCKIFWLTIGY